MTDYEYALQQLDALVCRVQEIRDLSTSSLGATYEPDFVMVEPILPSPLLIPHPDDARPKWSAKRLVAGSAAAAVSVVCFCLAVMMSLVHT